MRFSKKIIIPIIAVVALTSGLFTLYFINKKNQFLPTPSPSTSETPDIATNFSIEEAPSESLKGVITKLEGDVKILGRTATEEASLLNPNSKAQQGENYITGEDGSLSIVFEDILEIDIQNNSEVDIIQTLPAGIVFSQVNGESTYQKLGNYPVTIRTSYLLTEIDGEVDIKRDSEKYLVMVSVNSGTATFAYNDEDYISHVIKAEAGQTYTFNYDTRQGVLE